MEPTTIAEMQKQLDRIEKGLNEDPTHQEYGRRELMKDLKVLQTRLLLEVLKELQVQR